MMQRRVLNLWLLGSDKKWTRKSFLKRICMSVLSKIFLLTAGAHHLETSTCSAEGGIDDRVSTHTSMLIRLHFHLVSIPNIAALPSFEELPVEVFLA